MYVETVTIASAGTAQQATSVPVPDGAEVVYMGHPDNTGSIKVSDTAAKAQAATGDGNVPILANMSIVYQVEDPSIPYIDATVSGEKVIITFEF